MKHATLLGYASGLHRSCLLSLLWCSLSVTTKILSDIGSLNCLSGEVLGSSPGLLGSGWDILLVDLLINKRTSLREGALDKGALVESRTEEDGVKTKQDPRAFAEGQSREEETAPESDLKCCHKGHAAVIVLLHKLSNECA